MRAARVSEAGRVSMNSSRDESRNPGGKRKRKRGRVSFRSRVLPWSASSDDDARFRRIAERVLISCAIFFVMMPWLPVRKPDPTLAPVVSAPMARLMIEQAKPEPQKPKTKAKADLPKPPPEKAVALNNNKPDPIRPPARKPDAPAKVALNKEAPVPEARVPLPNKPPGEIPREAPK